MEEVEKLRAEIQKLLKEKKELQTALTKQQFDDKILHRQWKDVNELVSIKERELEELKLSLSRPRVSAPAVIGLMIAAMLLGAVATYFILPGRSGKPETSDTSSIPAFADTIPSVNKKGSPGSGDVPAERKRSRKQKVVKEERVESQPDPNTRRDSQNGVSTLAVNAPLTADAGSAPYLGEYKVKSKAFFYDEPDEHTRRKAFIIHWNNALLKPTGERGDYIYVVFTNHLGQTSQGWLNKKDLTRIE